MPCYIREELVEVLVDKVTASPRRQPDLTTVDDHDLAARLLGEKCGRVDAQRGAEDEEEIAGGNHRDRGLEIPAPVNATTRSDRRMREAQASASSVSRGSHYRGKDSIVSWMQGHREQDTGFRGQGSGSHRFSSSLGGWDLFPEPGGRLGGCNLIPGKRAGKQTQV